MMALWGGILLLLGGGLLGWGVTAQMNRRRRAVSLLREALCQIERELTLYLSPLPTLLQRNQLPFCAYFSTCGAQVAKGVAFGVCWGELVESLPDIREEERRILRPLGQVLGQFEGEVQAQALQSTVQQLEEIETLLREERRRLGRVYPAVGATAGAFLAIVLG